MPKRGRVVYTARRTAAPAVRLRRKYATVRAHVVPGFTRTGGFYGRFSRGGEMKFHDLTVDDAAIATAGTIAEDSANVIAQGNTESQRIGRKVTVKRIHWKYDVTLPAAANQDDVPNGDVARIILYLDKQANGATALVADILETANYQSFYQLANSNRFRILMDKTHNIRHTVSQTDGASTGSYGAVRHAYTFNKLCNIPIEYDNSATTGVITSQRSNNIGVLTISALGTSGFASQMRLRYTDA